VSLLRGHLRARAQPDLIRSVAVAQAMLALLGALAFALLALRGVEEALWAMTFTLLAGAPAGVAYALAARRATALLGALTLVGSQIALFAWGFELAGPRAALLLLAPALAVVAMRMGGRALAGFQMTALCALYASFALVSARAPGASVRAVLDLAVVVVGLAATYTTLVAFDRRSATAESRAKRWRDEAERFAALSDAQRAQMEEEGAYLRAALAEALHGRGVVRVALDGPLARLTETVHVVATRLLTLRRDRDERVRLEGALAQVIRAVEDTSLGAPARWPDQTGTPVDTLVDRLRISPPSAWRQGAHVDLPPYDFFAAAPHVAGAPESNIRYLFPRSSDSHLGGV
jgi:hypothetical protein